MDSNDRIPLESRVLSTARSVKTKVAVTSQAPEEKIAKIRETGANVLVVKEGRGYNVAVPHGVDLKQLFLSLKGMGMNKFLVEGGGELNWSLLRLGMVDELTVTIAPKIAGGRLATTLVEGDGFDQMSEGIKLRLERVERKKSGELVLRYRPT